MYKQQLPNIISQGYAEAKITDLVPLNDFKGAIMPNTEKYDKIADKLTELGLSVKRIDYDEKYGVYPSGKQFNKALEDIENEQQVLFQSAYHGSPYRFDSFTTDKIGTGEGAQAHGWGLYFALDKKGAEGYKRRLGDKNL